MRYRVQSLSVTSGLWQWHGIYRMFVSSIALAEWLLRSNQAIAVRVYAPDGKVVWDR